MNALNQRLGHHFEGANPVPSFEAADEVALNQEAVEMELAYQASSVATEDHAQLLSIADHLQTLTTGLEMSVEGGTLNTASYGFAKLSADHAVAGLGVETTMPSLENGDEDLEQLAGLGIEGMAETIRKVWEAIKAAVKKAIKAIADFFAKLFNNVDRLITKNKKLEKEVEKLEKEADGVSINVPTKHLKYGGDVSVQKTLIGMEVEKRFTKFVFVTFVEKAQSTFELLAFVLSDKGRREKIKGEEDLEIESAELFEQLNAGMDNIKDLTDKKNYLLGDKYVSKTPNRPPELTDHLLGKNRKDEVSINAATKSEMEMLLKLCGEVAEIIKGKKKALKDLTKARQDALDAAEGFVKDATNGKLDAFWTQQRVNTRLRMANHNFGKLIAQAGRHSFDTIRATHELVERSLSAHHANTKEASA